MMSSIAAFQCQTASMIVDIEKKKFEQFVNIKDHMEKHPTYNFISKKYTTKIRDVVADFGIRFGDFRKIENLAQFISYPLNDSIDHSDIYELARKFADDFKELNVRNKRKKMGRALDAVRMENKISTAALRFGVSRITLHNKVTGKSPAVCAMGPQTILTAEEGHSCKMIDSDKGFVEDGLLVFESKSTKDYHEEMDGERFLHWFINIMPKLEPGSVVVIDNAPYHSKCCDHVIREENTMWHLDDAMEHAEQNSFIINETEESSDTE
ncbi:unnamed protein product [Colias eurytheme]|nr:unnamed protein product [Colias eurytheme]